MVDKADLYEGSDADPPEYGWTTLPRAGVQYLPGTYPTPELAPYPKLRYRILEQTQRYTSITIQSALDSLGEHSTLYLPQKTCWAVSKPIKLKPNQELATWGYPTTEGDMATLMAESTCQPHILDCNGVQGTQLRNLKIDGRHEVFGDDEDCHGLVFMGGKGGNLQVIDHCVIMHPRGSYCIEVPNGGYGTKVTNNTIGPAGTLSKSGPEKGICANGIAFDGEHGLVAGNKIFDTTGRAIVLLGSPGTFVTSNTIVVRHRHSRFGIDITSGVSGSNNYESARITHNTISIQGSFLGIGVSQGPLIGFERKNKRVISGTVGALVSFNLIESKPVDPQRPGTIGCGFVVTKVRNWRCTDNVSEGDVRYEGTYREAGRNVTLDGPTAFILLEDLEQSNESDTSLPRNQFQSQFVRGKAARLAT